MIGRHTFSDTARYEQRTLRADSNYDLYDIAERSGYTNTVLYLVPASYRYNLNGVIGLGAGVQLSAVASQKVDKEATHQYYLFGISANGQREFRERNTKLDFSDSKKEKESFSGFNTALFADVILGSSRIGPSLGVRYHYYFDGAHDQWQFYATWKF
jgi:hypothetical protein